MKNFQIEALLANVGQIINLMNGLNVHKESALTHAATLKDARIKLDQWKEKYTNEEYKSKLSPAEQKAILDNAQAMYGVHQELVKELEYLDMAKHPAFLTNAINELTHGFLLLEWLSEYVGKSGRTVLPHLTAIKAETFDKGKYVNQINSLYTELEALGHDLYVDHVVTMSMLGETINNEPMLIPICDRLTVAACWLLKEKERLATEAAPEHRVIKLPEEIVPEVPKSPENEEAKP